MPNALDWSSTGSTSQTKYNSSCRRLHGTAPAHLMNSCTLTSTRQHLLSASQRKLIVPHYRMNSVSVVGVLLSRASRPGVEFAARQTVFMTQHWVSIF